MRSSLGYILLTVLSSAAFAQQSPPTNAPSPRDMHSPHSAQPPANTSVQQTPPSAAQAADMGVIFDKLNVSRTGKLTKAEAQAHPPVPAHIHEADTNQDGIDTKEEFLAAFRPAQ